MEMIDFHCHFVPPRWELTTTHNRTGRQLEQWLRINAKLSDRAALMTDVESGDLAARVVNVPTALIADAGGEVPPGTVPAINDALAAMVRESGGRLIGLAAADAFGGEAAAREVARAVTELGLSGLFVDCAKGDLFLDCAASRPVLAAAARLGVPVFVHPVDPQPLSRQMAPYGRVAGLLARGTANAASLIAMVEGGVFEELPELQVVVTSLALGGVLLMKGFAGFSGRGEVSSLLRRNLYIDTLSLDPAAIRAAVDCVGAERVLLGSDWPILNDAPVAARAARALAEAGLTEAERRLVAAGNARRLLRVPPRTASPGHAIFQGAA